GYGNVSISSYADAFVFDEMGITFSVYPDGEFDFYLPENNTACITTPHLSVSFNSGYNYDPYVQYDDFGAIIQVENVQVWYDYYGRVSQIGDVMINYRDRRVCQVGGMFVHYDWHGHYAYHTGFINAWNPYFVYRPFYVSFRRPLLNLCFVQLHPYRQFYRPVRYAYYRPYVHNVRPHHVVIGHTYRPNGNGVAHHRYTQTAGRGEVAVRRARRTVTRADASPRPTNVNRGRTEESYSNRKPSSTAGNRATKPRTVQSGASRTITSNPSSNKPASSTTRTLNTKSRNNRSVSSGRSNENWKTGSSSNRSQKPSSTRTQTAKPRSNSSARQSTNRSVTRTHITKPASRAQNNVQQRSTGKSSGSRSVNRTAAKPQSASRKSSTKPRSAARSAGATTTKGGSKSTRIGRTTIGSPSKSNTKGTSTRNAKRGK
ncbi:MAG: hypothetical protein QF371_08105, partial [Flavobacteriales bacterium]|nr:hypothetical protein [Flavobacteriales bacterium]